MFCVFICFVCIKYISDATGKEALEVYGARLCLWHVPEKSGLRAPKAGRNFFLK